MFQFFRRKDKAVRIFLGGLLVMVCVMMVVTLIPGLGGTGPSGESVLAKVGGEEITSSEVARQLQQMMRNSRIPASMMNLYTPTVVNQMVIEKATLLEARRLGLSVSGEELASQLRSNTQFFPEGKFIGNEQYQNFIEARFGMTVPQFEERYQQMLLVDKLRKLVTAGVTVPEDEIQREFHRRNDKIRIDYVVLKASDVKDKLQISEADLAASFQKSRSRYEMPERRKFKLVFVNTATLRDSAPVSDEEIRRFYNQNKDRFRVEDRVRVAHILFKTVGKTPEETEEVRKKAEAVLQRVQKGEDFAKLAKENSDDAASTPKGGDLGWIVRGQTVPEFEKTAFSLEPGKLSGVIKTVYGFHIVKLLERQRAHQQTLEEVRDQILPQLRQQKANQLADELMRKADAATRKSPGDVQAIANQIGQGGQVLETGLLKRGDPLAMAGTSPAIEDALFASGMKPNQIAGPLQTPAGIIIASLVQASPAHPAELAEVHDQAINDLRNERASQEVSTRMTRLAEQGRKEGDLKKAAAAMDLKVSTSELVSAQDSIKDLGSAGVLGDNAFQMKVGDVGGPVAVVDGQAVFRVAERQPATPEAYASSRDSIRSQLLDTKANMLFQVFTDSLKTRLEREGRLRVNDAAIQRLAASFKE